MPPPKNGTELLDLVRKSGLLEKQKIEGYVGTLQKEGSVEPDPTRLASRLIKDGIVTVFQARQMLRGRYRGFFLGKYKVLEPIGSGGMADIYLCEHTAMRHKVAVKILPLEKLKDPSLLGRFRREAQAIATLNHPNIVRAYDLDHEGSLHYMVTEYINGCDLQEFVKRNGPLIPERAANYIAQAAAGLQHLHEAELVHRDIKPGNLLLDRTGVVKLLDLGLARFNDVERQDNLTREFDDGRVLGTADYIAPEQSIKGSEVDIRADIYSLGGSFYFMLQGSAPFEGASVTQKLLFHQIKDPPPLPSSVPKELTELVRFMMMKKPERRPQKPVEVVNALLPYLDHAFPPLESELPSRSSIFNSGPKTSIPKSASHLSSRLSSTSLGATPLSGSSARLAPRSGIDNALRTTPVSGVNVGTKPIPPVVVTVPEVVEDHDETQDAIIPPPLFTVQRSSYLRENKWLILGCVVAILLLVAAIVFAFLAFAKNEKVSTQPTSSILSIVQDSEPPAPRLTNVSEPEATANKLPSLLTSLAAAVPKGPPPVNALRVTASGAEGTYRLIRNALLKGGSNSHIVVLDPEHQEQLDIDGASGLKNVTIEAWPTTTQPVILRAPPLADHAKPIISISSAPGIHFKDFVIDGQGKSSDLILLTGPCEDSSFQNVHLLRFNRAALVLSGLAGQKNKPVQLSYLRALANTEVESAIRLEHNDLGKNQYIQIDHCRFEGPFHAAILLSGAVDQLDLTFNRFFKNNVALRYRPADNATTAVNLTASNNVFYQATHAGIYFDTPLSDNSSWTLRNNLFLESPRIAIVERADLNAPADQSAQWIWSTDRVENQPTVIPKGVYRFRKSFVATSLPSQAGLDISAKETFKVWLNGTLVGSSRTDHYNQRVYHFPVAKFLKTGSNILAVEATNDVDPVLPSLGTSAALLISLTDAEGRSLVTTDTTWKSATITPDDWSQPSFNDSSWNPVKAWTGEPTSFPWRFAVWDSRVQASLGAALMPPLKAVGNIRDYQSWEGYPNLNATRGMIEEKRNDFGTNPTNEATFLRYPRNHPLMKLGPDGAPVGYAQEK